MNCTYYKWNNGRWFGTNYCLKEERKISSRHYQEYCSRCNYDKCEIYQENQIKNCIFTTILCEKMGQPIYNNAILINLKNFRKNVLEKDDKYKELLVCHDRISSIISDAIRNTTISSIDEFLSIIYSNYLVPINNFILNNDIENAIRRYKKMLELLIVNFSLGKEIASIRYEYKYPERTKIKLRTKNIIK